MAADSRANDIAKAVPLECKSSQKTGTWNAKLQGMQKVQCQTTVQCARLRAHIRSFVTVCVTLCVHVFEFQMM